jgi:hypothetical protein
VTTYTVAPVKIGYTNLTAVAAIAAVDIWRNCQPLWLTQKVYMRRALGPQLTSSFQHETRCDVH